MTALRSPPPRWRNLALLALLLAPLLWPLQQLAERYYRNELTEQNRQTLTCTSPTCSARSTATRCCRASLVTCPPCAPCCSRTPPQVRDNANRLLKRLRNQTGADVIYLMATDGNTLAASNWDEEDSLSIATSPSAPTSARPWRDVLALLRPRHHLRQARLLLRRGGARRRPGARRAGGQGRSGSHRDAVGTPGAAAGDRQFRRGDPHLAARLAFPRHPRAGRGRARADRLRSALPDALPAGPDAEYRRLADPEPRAEGDRLDGAHPRAGQPGRAPRAHRGRDRRRHCWRCCSGSAC